MKKSLGPIVASSFLLVVVVISTVTFQNWFTGFEASTLAGAESKTAGSSNGTTRIQDVIGTSLYFQNGFPNISIQSVRIYEYDCNVSTTLGSGLSTVALGNNCTQNLPSERAEISIVTDKGIFRGNFYNEHAGVNTSVSSEGGGGGSPTPSLSLSSNDTSIDYNGDINLSWTASNVASCSAYGGWSGSKSNTTGSEIISSITSNTTFTLNCTGSYGNVSDSVSVAVGPNLCISGSTTFSYTGSDQTFTMTENCSRIEVKAWGAGGGGGRGFDASDANGPGGGGGYSFGNFSVLEGTTIRVVVGAGGIGADGTYTTASVYGGGGGRGFVGGGGGYSGIFLSSVTHSNALLIAGAGGGGGGWNEGTSGDWSGGGGGGTSGEDGSTGNSAAYGLGGNQTAGGLEGQGGNGGGIDGSALQGGYGDQSSAGGGGGGGYYGGGGGNYVGGGRYGPGGGGSGFINSSYSGYIGGTLTGSTSQTAANSGDSDRGSLGDGGASSVTSGTTGDNGIVKIYYY